MKKTILLLFLLNHVNNSLISTNNDENVVETLTIKSTDYYDEYEEEGVIKVPLSYSNQNEKLKWIIKAPIDQRITIFLDYFDLFGCIDGNKYEYLRIGPNKNGYFNSCELINDEYLDKTYFKLNSINNSISIEYKRSNLNLNDKLSFQLLYRSYPINLTTIQNCNEIIKNKYKCDCYNDCENLKDELCDDKCSKIEIDSNIKDCFYCIDPSKEGKECKSLNMLCDGQNDCLNKLDELNCQQQQQIPTIDLNNCVNVFRTDNYGSISSPNIYSNATSSSNQLNCSYHVIVEPYEKIQIRIKKFNLRPFYLTTGGNQKPTIFDFDYLSIYDGDSVYSPLIANLNSQQDKQNKMIFNSKSNSILIIFHAAAAAASSSSLFGLTPTNQQQQYFGFNLTYQVKGLCIDDQKSCSSPIGFKNELNCFDKEQRCDDQWDCNSGVDEVDCGIGSICSNAGQYRCKNRLSCFKYEDRCDGEHQCLDKSDENNCNSWFCNSDNGTFLCLNKKCIYEQWVCDGTNDCDDNSDEVNCPTPFTRRVITTAVLGGTLCLLLLVMALGCACKLYTLRTVDYRTTNRSRNRRRRLRAAAAASTNRRSFSLFNLLRRTPPSTTTNNNLPSPSSSSNNNRLVRSSSMSSIDYQNLVAPPTYNQTMGLVDEYEQRQLAFIEHVRSMINNSSSSSTATTSATANQTTTTTRSHRRRSHSARHHHHSSSSRNQPTPATTVDPQQQTTIINLNDQTIIQSLNNRHQRRRHRHHRQNGVASAHYHHHHYHHQQPQDTRSRSTITNQQQQQTSSSTNRDNQQQQVSKVTTNLKDRLAKLIKDIVNHGDNIQYVQLGERSSNPIENQSLSSIATSNQHSIPLERRNQSKGDDENLID